MARVSELAGINQALGYARRAGKKSERENKARSPFGGLKRCEGGDSSIRQDVYGMSEERAARLGGEGRPLRIWMTRLLRPFCWFEKQKSELSCNGRKKEPSRKTPGTSGGEPRLLERFSGIERVERE